MNVQTKVLSRDISEYLWRNGQTIATAESCTAGLVAAALAALPGASTYFRGGVVTYVNDLKTKLLGVQSHILDEVGAVSEEVARAMAEGAIDNLGTSYAVAVTGYAGPGGGDEAPVGTIWVAAGRRGDIITAQLTGDEGREVNLQHATLAALQLLRDKLRADFPVEAAATDK
ncbi:MAG: CinA family protein [Bacteroidaceae bacterium]|nr:CinA family protein [Bacteroidaceae bacterium]